jgi:PGF-pre-PGF domain-containing protein
MITSPQNNSENNTGFINVTVTLDRAGNASLSWDGGANESMDGSGTRFYKNKTNLMSGNYTFKVFVNDSYGSTNSTGTRTVIVNLTNTTSLPQNSAGNVTMDVNITSPSGNVTVTIFNTTNATVNGTRITNITINSLRTVPYALTDSNDRFIGENLTLGPDGAVFNPAIRLNFNYNDSQLGTIPASRLKIKFYNVSTGIWGELTTTVNINSRIATATTTHFSTFALTGTPEPASNPPSSSSGGSSGGGGGGGTSGETFANIIVKEKYDLQIYKDIVTSYKFTNLNNPILSINIVGNVNAGEIGTAVEVLRNTSSLVKSPAPGNVYKNVNLWVGTSGFASPKNIKEAEIIFKIENSWISSNNIRSSSIKMVRWDGSKWDQLETSEITKDSNFSYFNAKTNAFSSFAITQLGNAVSSAMPQAQSGIPAIVTDPTPGEAIFEGVPQIDFAIMTAVFAIIGIFIAIYLKRRRNFKK